MVKTYTPAFVYFSNERFNGNDARLSRAYAKEEIGKQQNT